jgi:hypothetical protein
MHDDEIDTDADPRGSIACTTVPTVAGLAIRPRRLGGDRQCCIGWAATWSCVFPAYPVAWNFLAAGARNQRARGTYSAGLRVDDATWARGRGWALSIALVQLPYYLNRNPALAAE